MNTWIYQTTDKQYGIKLQSDPTWEQVFGNAPIYLICKYDESLHKYNVKTNYAANLSEYYIVRSEEKLKNCFKWLVINNIITVEEMKSNRHLWS